MDEAGRATGVRKTERTAVPFEALRYSDLVVDASYQGGRAGNASDDPIARIVPVGNQGGFRRSTKSGETVLAVLYTSGSSTDWPDRLDLQLGQLTYFGDNRTPGRDLHSTPRGGNALLRDAFGWAGIGDDRRRTPPFLVFEKGAAGRDVVFRGVAAPGQAGVPLDESLVAVWRHRGGHRFQNYRATFTILDIDCVRRSWLDEVLSGHPLHESCPGAWRDWVSTGRLRPLIAEPTLMYRKRDDQMPAKGLDTQLLATITDHFRDDPWGFEACALAIWRLIAPDTGQADLTRRWRDGGRDAVGHYLIGPVSDPVPVEFALEGKCYAPTNGVGVKETSRLISRLRHRQFGVFVTTSYFAQQAYEEIRADQHPVALVCGRDIVEALRAAWHTSVDAVAAWLDNLSPLGSAVSYEPQ